MESSSSRRLLQIRTHTSITNREKFVSKRIAPAILEKSCPICLRHIEDRRAAVIAVCMHAYCIECIHRWSNLKRKCPLCNADFDSWFFKINLSSRTFHKEQLPSLNDPKNVNIVDVYGRQTDRLTEQRIIRRSREELSNGANTKAAIVWPARVAASSCYDGKSSTVALQHIRTALAGSPLFF